MSRLIKQKRDIDDLLWRVTAGGAGMRNDFESGYKNADQHDFIKIGDNLNSMGSDLDDSLSLGVAIVSS